MNCVVAGRKVSDTSATKIASGAVNKTGADAIVWVLIPACAVAQIEQVWRAVAEFSSLSLCEWVACAIPITHISTIASTHTALTNTPRLEETRNMLCNDSILRWSPSGTQRSKNEPSVTLGKRA